MKCNVELRNVYLNIPVFAPNSQRLIRRPLFLSSVGGNLQSQNGKVHVQALKAISFALEYGNHLGLIGHNGAGKTTLLKVIAGIYPPSTGDVIVNGTVGFLFDTGGSVTPEMTGNECIKFQHLVYGSPAEDWRRLVDDVTEFTELGSYLSLPIRTYSEGMKARLMAALATAWKRDILLIDEGIGAGDAAFQDKMSRRINNLLESAGLLVIASHSAELLRTYCKRGIVLVHGEIKMIGDLEDALNYYAKLNRSSASEQ